MGVAAGDETTQDEQKKESTWNLKKTKAWDVYKEVSNKYADKLEEVIEDRNLNMEEVIKKAEKLQDAIKYTAFGKTKVISKKVMKVKPSTEEDEATEELLKQSKKMEDEITKVTTSKQAHTSPGISGP